LNWNLLVTNARKLLAMHAYYSYTLRKKKTKKRLTNEGTTPRVLCTWGVVKKLLEFLIRYQNPRIKGAGYVAVG